MALTLDFLGRHWRGHRWRMIAGGFLLTLALLAGLVHTPLVRAGVLSWALARLPALGLQAEVGGLRYNLFTLTVGLETVTLTAVGSETPFFSTDAVQLDLPWSIVRGPLAIQSLEITRPRIAIVREDDGSLNLPETAETAPTDTEPMGPLRIDRLVVEELGARYADTSAALSVDGRGITLALNRLPDGQVAGRLSMSDGVTLRLGDRETTVATLEGGVAFDGTALSVEALTLEAPETRIRLDGTVGLLADDPQIDIRYEGRVDVERVAPWAGLEPTPRGSVAFSGSARGPLTAPDATLDVTSDGLAWSTLGEFSLEASAEMSGSVATLQSFRVALAGGEISGDARVQLEGDGPSRARAQFSSLNLGTLAGMAPDLPVSIASVADGNVSLEWTDMDVTSAQGQIAARLTAPTSRAAALALAGRLDAALDRGMWTLSLDQRIAGTVVVRGSGSGQLASDDLAASTMTGRATLEVASVPEALRRLRAARLEIDPALATRVRGALSSTFAFSGTFGNPRATGSMKASDLWLDETGPGVAEVGFDATSRDVMLDLLRLAIGPNVITGNVAIGLESNRLGGTITAELPDLAPLVLALPVEWRPTGSADVDAQLGGTLDNPTIQLTLSSRDLRVAGQSFRTVQSQVRFANQVATISELEVTQDEGRLTATGRYETTGGRYAFDLNGEGLAIAPLLLREETDSDEEASSTIPLDARFDLAFSGEGTVASPQAQGFVQFAYFDWSRSRLGAVRADVAIEEGRAQVTATVPSVNSTLEAAVELDAPRAFTVTAAVIDADLSALVQPTGPAGAPTPDVQPVIDPDDLAGALALQVNGSGDLDDLPGATFDLELRLVDVALGGAPLRLARPARLRYAGDELIADDFELRIGSSTLSAQGALGTTTPGAGEGLLVRLAGSLADFVPFARLAPAAEAFDASGAIDLQVRATGSLEAPTVAGDLSVLGGSFTSGALPPVSDVALTASYAGGLLEVSEMGGRWQGVALTASGRMPAALLGDMLPEGYLQSLPQQDGTARATARMTSITPDTLAPFVDQQTLDAIAGRFDATIQIETETLDPNDVRADVTLDRAEIELARVPLQQTRPTHLRLADGLLEVVDWNWAGAGNRFEVFGGANIAGETPTLNLAVVGLLDLRMLGTFAPDIATAGRASFDIRADGPASDPRIEGQAMIEDGNIILREPRFAITDLEGIVTLTRDRLQLRTLTANANGGTVRVNGAVDYPDLELTGGTITITGRGLAFEIPANLRTEVNTDLLLSLAQDAPSLTGSVTILRGSYRQPISLAGQLLTGVEVASVAPEEAEPTFADRIRLTVSVVSEEDIIIDNNYARLNLGSNLRVIGTVAEPVLAGRLTILEGGEIFLGGRTYRVARGTVDFTNATQIEPNVNLALDTRVQRYDITLEVSGTPETLEASLRSPGMSQEDVVSLLLTGQTATGSTTAQTEIARGQLLMLLSGELLGFAGRAVGLDSVQVGRGLGGAASDFDLLAVDTDPSARLTVAKDLRRDVEIVFSQSLRESGDITWIAIYRPLRYVEIRGTTEDDNSRAYEFRHELNFGGGLAPRTLRDSSGGADARVVAVRFTGMPGFSEQELRDVTRLEGGDRFDFYRWQQDQDRLLAFYHDRDYLEARITARRLTDENVGEEPGVTLEYRIERGPRTTLTVDGFTLQNGVVQRMTVAWGRAVFDGFLLEDLQTMARQALVEQRYLQPEISALVTSPPESETKEITIRITPGPRFDDRRIVFSGNVQVASRVLDGLVRTRRLDATAWLDPAGLETAIEQYYRSIGHLDADVTVDPPAFSGRSATLPVRVTEGQQAQIASVEVHGATARAEAEVREAFGVSAGSVYLPSALEPARRAVEIGYQREGYNDARVSVTTLVDRDQAQVNIALNIDEGRRQILSQIDVSGAEATSRGTVDGALRLEPGQPANLTDYSQAQKRLYDTGVFQSADVVIEPIDAAPAVEGEAQPVRAAVTLVELPRYRFRYGFRLSDEVGPTEAGREVRPAFIADLLRRNFLGRAISTGVAGQIEAKRRLARTFISLPQVFGLPVTSNLFLTASREETAPGTATFIEDLTGITAEQRFRPARTMAVTYGYSFTRTHVFQLEEVLGLPKFEVTAKVARLTGTYAWDTRDDPSNAHRGWFHSSGLEYGPEALGSDLRFIRYLAQQYYFKTVGGNVVLASAFRLGAGRGFGQDLIPSEKFFTGGSTSVRGFAEDGLGEQNFFGDPLGGNSLLLLNQEVRFPLFGWVRGAGFFDAGNVFPAAGDLSFTNIEAGAGMGVRIHSPFALIRIDFGTPLTRRQEEPSWRWYFAIGQAF